MPDESQELIFPMRGVDVVAPASDSPLDTAEVGVNVRICDPFLARERGGSRWGSSRLPNDQADGSTPVQHLGIVVHYTPDALLTQLMQNGELEAPGGFIADDTDSPDPDGPGPGDPGGGPNAPTSPPFPPGFNRRTPASPPAPYPRVRPQLGSGIQPNRGIGPTDDPFPPPPPPPGPVTRTYTPFVEYQSGEIVGIWALGPVTLPLTPPTDFGLTGGLNNPITYYGDQWQVGTLDTWAGAGLPSLGDINGFYTGFDHGPYESVVDS